MSKLKDLTGQTFGRLTVVSRLPNYVQPNGRTRTRWLCKCECGKEYIGDGSHLLHGNVKSCGCLHRETSVAWAQTKAPAKASAQARRRDLTSKQFGKLTVIEFAGNEEKARKSMWKCRCECGSITVVRSNHLLRGLIRSCGCTQSFAEEVIIQFLNELDVTYAKEVAFPDLVSSRGGLLRFDFAFYDSDKNLLALLEYQGAQHSMKRNQDFGRQQREETDALKEAYCKEHNIPLYQIWYSDNVIYELISALTDIYRMTTPCQADLPSEGVTTIS